MTIFILFIFGLFTGSFLNVLIYRLPRGQQWLTGRSSCPHCKHSLYWHDLIPLLSWLYLKAKCRYCRKPISWQYPAVELTNALLWAGIGLLTAASCQLSAASCQLSGIGRLGFEGWPLISNTVIVLLLASCLLTLFVIDFRHYIIPDQLVIVLIGLGTTLGIISGDWTDIFYRLIWGIGAFVFFYFLHSITRGKGMGFGDVKLAFAMGLILKSSVTVALMSAFILGSLIGIVLLATGRKHLKQPIPFGPFLVAGTMISLVYGEKILNWYLAGLGY